MEADHDYLTPREVAEVLRVDVSTVHRWAKTGAIESVRIGGTVRILRATLAALLESPREGTS